MADAPCLLVLDNLEHLLRDTPFAGKNDNAALSGCAGLIRLLLLRAPGLVCLATSRTRAADRRRARVPACRLSPCLRQEKTVTSRNILLTNESVALYVDRARAVRPDFALTAANAPAVAALCRRLEGMPLAIEMAAAWVKTMPPHKMLERLERQLDMLVSRRRDLPPRHQSLRATIEWSYDLLAPNLQAFFTRSGRVSGRVDSGRGGSGVRRGGSPCPPRVAGAFADRGAKTRTQSLYRRENSRRDGRDRRERENGDALPDA